MKLVDQNIAVSGGSYATALGVEEIHARATTDELGSDAPPPDVPQAQA